MLRSGYMFLVFLILATLPAIPGLAAEATGFYLVKYSPGRNWDTKLDYDAQLGIGAHKAHLQELYDKDILLMGGPLLDETGAIILLKVNTREQAESIARRDPAVVSQILATTVSAWRVEMSTMRRFRRNVPEVTDPDAPFRVERLDPNPPINLKED